MYRNTFIFLLVVALVSADALTLNAQRRGGGRVGGRSGGSRPSVSRPAGSSSRAPSYRGQPTINRSAIDRNAINRNNINRSNLPTNINRSGNNLNNINRSNTNRNNNLGSGSRSSANRSSIDSFLGGSSSSRASSKGGPSTLPSPGGGWNSKTFETARGGTITVGQGAGGKTGPGGSQVGVAGKGIKIETAGGKTVSKGSLAAGGRNSQGNAAVGGVTGGRASDGRGNAVGGVRGGAVDNRGNYRGGSATGRKNNWGYAQVNVRGVSGNLNTGRRNVTSRTAVRGPWGNVVTTGRGASFVNGQFVGGRTWTTVNGNFTHWNYYGPRWWVRYPSYWWPRRWVVGTVWWVASWNTAARYVGIDDPGIYYDYGENVTFDDENVFYEDNKISSTDEFYENANAIAEAGLDSKNDEWMPLGVFAYVKDPDQTETERVLQLALNKDRAIRGNMHDLLTDKVIPVYGSAEKETQRVALKMEGNDSVVLEVGLYNLTNDEVPVLIHFSRDKRQDAMLIRLKNSEEKQPEESQK